MSSRREDFLGAAAAQEEVVALEKELCALRAESTSTILCKQLAEKCKAVDEFVKVGNYAGAAAAQEEVKKMQELVSADVNQGPSQNVDAADPEKTKML